MQNTLSFDTIKTIAIVGLSDDPKRYSYQVAMYLRTTGFQIIPVNPNITKALGEDAYGSLVDIPKEVSIDLVDIFRKSEYVVPIVQEAIERGTVKTIWMQEGVSNVEGKKLAEEHGIEVVMDMCMMKAYQSDH